MVEGGGLENRFPVLRNGGSNPSPSATVVLLRGINNVGSKRVNMAALKSAFESMGFDKVRTVLASGNIIVESPRRGPRADRTIAHGLERTLGFPVAVIIRTFRELKAIIDSKPFKDAPSGSNVQHYVTFLKKEEGIPPSRVRLPPPPKGVSIVRVDPGEIYSIDNVSFNSAPPLPEPSAYVVLIAGFGAILAATRARARRG